MIFFIAARIGLGFADCVEIGCQDTFDPYYRCVEVTATIKVSGCPAGMYCPSYSSIASYNQSLDFLDTYCEPNPYQEPVDLCTNASFTGTQSVGEECCKDSNCASNSCTNLKCSGLQASSACTDSSACAPGLYCKNNLCTVSLPSGSSCEQDEECGVGYGCNNKFCVKLWSVKFTKAADDPKFCDSNYAFGDHCDRIVIKLNSTKELFEPFECSVYDTCTYVSAAYEQIIYSSSCLCSGVGNDTKGYCGLFINQVEEVYGDLYKNMQYTKSDCSGDKAHSGDPYELWQCGSISSEVYEKYVIQNKRNNNWNVYKSGVLDKCAETITIFQVSFGAIWGVFVWAGFLF